MTEDEAREKLIEACEAGRVEFRDGKAIERMDIRNPKPDFTVTDAKVSQFEKNWLVIEWGTVSAGFGELTLTVRDGKLYFDTESMSREFVKAVLAKLVDTTRMDIDPE